MKLEVTDLKGDDWVLLMPGYYEGGADIIMWCMVLKGPAELQHYPELPIPVYVEWWP